MHAGWSEEQQRLFEQARQFAAQELEPGRLLREQQPLGLRDGWRRCARFGLFAMTVPEQWGGLGQSALANVAVMEGLGEGCSDNGLLLSLGAQLWSVLPPLLHFGTPAQLERYLPGMISGEIISAFALTEPGSGSDTSRLQCHAEAIGQNYLISGQKTFISNAPVADLFLVFATTAAGAGPFAISAFLVERNNLGIRIGPLMEKMGLHSSPMSEMWLEEVEVPATQMLGSPGSGGMVMRYALEWERGLLLAPAVGTMQRLLQQTLLYCRERKQFGRPILQFEAVAHQLAEMSLRLEVSRLLLENFARLKDAGRSAVTQAAMTKLYVSESLNFVSATALHLHGANGYTTAYPLEREWRDARAASIYSGSTEMQRNLIAEALLNLGVGASR